MRNAELQIVLFVAILGVLATTDFAWAEEAPSATRDAGVDGAATLLESDAGTDQLSDLAPGDSHAATVDAGFADIGDAAVHPDAGLDTEIPSEHLAKPIFSEAPSERGQNMPVVTARAPAVSANRLPLLGVMLDIGVPDGLMGSLVFRPWSWLRASAGGGSNSIGNGWRAGVTLLPAGSGPSASLEYGRYQDGDANALAKKFVGGNFNGSPALERIGYEFMNAHLGLDFGFRNVVFYLHGGVTMVRGQIHNLDAAIGGAGATGTTEVVVRRDPNFRAVGPSIKLGLLVYVW
jgi:hypothetical protein